MEVDYRKLRGRIVEKFDSMAKFGKALGKSESWIYKKMDGALGLSRNEISKWCVLLEIPQAEIPEYFFKEKV